MSWIVLIIVSILIVGYLTYKIKNVLYHHKVDRYHTIIKECNIAIFKIKNVDLHDFNKLLSIQKDLYAKGIRPEGFTKKKYFLAKTPDLTLDTIQIYSIDLWHLDSLAFWNRCDKEIGENNLNLPENTLHKTLVFNRYKNILTGSIGDYLYKIKTDYAKFTSKPFVHKFR